MGELPNRPLKVGIFLNDDDRISGWASLRELACIAESVGFDSIWVGDHLLFRSGGQASGPIEAWSALAALAVATDRVELGPLVACASFRNPALLAKTAAALDDISGGRLILGLGSGWNETEYEAFGFPFDHRVARFEEAFLIVRTLLHEGAIDFPGTYYQVRDCELLPKVTKRGRPPLLVGSTGARMLRAALPYVDAWNAWYTDTRNRAEGARSLSDRVDAACIEIGRSPDSVERTVAVFVRPALEGQRADTSPHDGIVPLSGTADEIAAGLLAYAAVGISHVQLVLNPITPALVAALAPVLELLDRTEWLGRDARSD